MGGRGGRGGRGGGSSGRTTVGGKEISAAEYKARNKALVGRLKKALGNDASSFSQFRNLSQLYRTSKIDVDQYYAQFVGLFGPANANRLLPDLIATLPNQEKRSELAAYHKSAIDTPSPSSSSNNNSNSNSNSGSNSNSRSARGGRARASWSRRAGAAGN